MEENRYYIVKDRKLWEQEDTGIYNSKLENLQITYGVFELIEDEIDIQAIEEFNSKYIMNTVEFQLQDKLNKVVRAIKQLDNKIKEK